MHRSPARVARIAAGILLLAATHSRCAPSRQAAIESLEGGQSRILPLTFASLEGRRDGDRVKATLEFQNLTNRDRLTIRMEIDLGPPIRLAGGTFRFQGASWTQAGKVDSPSLDFQAGQSGGMGLGGIFLLLDDVNKKLYRVYLPPTVMGVAYR
jgi:hypothetical protein